MLTVTVRGIPAAQARPRFFGLSRVYSPKTGWYHEVRWTAAGAAPIAAWDGPLALRVEYRFPRPKSVPLWQFWKWTKPDLDNLQKAVKDALSAARWWVDDARVAQSTELKRYARPHEQPGADITVTRLDPKGGIHDIAG